MSSQILAHDNVIIIINNFISEQNILAFAMLRKKSKQKKNTLTNNQVIN